jgi:catechol 2,3-dioxygenase-like lactoylglutathione lyase family enzyme
MTVSQLEHCAIRTVRLEECRKFYRDIMGLVEGPRPPLGIPGIWFYSGANAIVHITYRPENNAQPRRPEGPVARAPDSGYLDHVAFKATGLRQMMQRLQEHGIPFREASIPSIHLHQLFFSDPDGVQIELDYSMDELSAARPAIED